MGGRRSCADIQLRDAASTKSEVFMVFWYFQLAFRKILRQVAFSLCYLIFCQSDFCDILLIESCHFNLAFCINQHFISIQLAFYCIQLVDSYKVLLPSLLVAYFQLLVSLLQPLHFKQPHDTLVFGYSLLLLFPILLVLLASSQLFAIFSIQLVFFFFCYIKVLASHSVLYLAFWYFYLQLDFSKFYLAFSIFSFNLVLYNIQLLAIVLLFLQIIFGTPMLEKANR